MENVKTRLTTYKDDRNHIVYKIEIYKRIKCIGRCVITEVYDIAPKIQLKN